MDENTVHRYIYTLHVYVLLSIAYVNCGEERGLYGKWESSRGFCRLMTMHSLANIACEGFNHRWIWKLDRQYDHESKHSRHASAAELYGYLIYYFWSSKRCKLWILYKMMSCLSDYTCRHSNVKSSWWCEFWFSCTKKNFCNEMKPVVQWKLCYVRYVDFVSTKNNQSLISWW